MVMNTQGPIHYHLHAGPDIFWSEPAKSARPEALVKMRERSVPISA